MSVVLETIVDEKEIQRIIERATDNAVKNVLKNLGLDTSDQTKVQRDFIYLRDWRECVESIRAKGMLTVVTVAITGVLAVLLIGMKEWLK